MALRPHSVQVAPWFPRKKVHGSLHQLGFVYFYNSPNGDALPRTSDLRSQPRSQPGLVQPFVSGPEPAALACALSDSRAKLFVDTVVFPVFTLLGIARGPQKCPVKNL